MDKDRLNEVLTVALGAVALLAIIGLVINNRFETNELLSAVIDFSQISIPIIVLIVASSMRKENKTFSYIGKKVLRNIQKKHSDILMGPRYSRENYDPEKGAGMEYLFITNDDPKSKLRAKFIPIQPLEEGIVAIYVQKGTLVYGLNYSSDEATPKAIGIVQKAVKKAVTENIESKYQGLYEILDGAKNDSAIIINFEEERMGQRKFAKALKECATIAVETVKSYKK